MADFEICWSSRLQEPIRYEFDLFLVHGFRVPYGDAKRRPELIVVN